MRTSYAWAPRNQPAVAKEPFQRGKNITTIATMTTSGMGEMLCFEGAADKHIMSQFIREVLAPAHPQGGKIVLDNASIHNNNKFKNTAKRYGFQLQFLPAYSPDFSPIELTFSPIKHFLKKDQPTTIDEVAASINKSSNRLTSETSRKMFSKCGYGNSFKLTA